MSLRARFAPVLLAIAFSFTLLPAAPTAAQTTLNPRVVQFLPSPHHSTVGSNGQPTVSGYQLEFYAQNSTVAVARLDLGKPDAEPDGLIYVDFVSLPTRGTWPDGPLQARVFAAGPSGRTGSLLSNVFAFNGCAYTVSPGTVSVPAGGGSFSVSIATAGGCEWTAESPDTWLSVESGTAGTGSGNSVINVSANATGAPRTGVVTIGGATVTVEQAAGSSSEPPAPPENVAPSVKLISPWEGQTFTAQSAVTLVAEAADADGSVVAVDFYAGSTRVGSSRTSPYQISWTVGRHGTYAITAIATDDAGGQARSAPVSITVRKKSGR